MDIGTIRKRRKPPTRSVRICIDPDLLAERDRLRRLLDEVRRTDERSNSRDRAPQVEADLAAVEAEIRDATVTFTFRALPRAEWRRLVAAHPPADGDAADGLDFDPDGICAPLLAAASVDPEISLSDAEAIVDEWSEAEVTALFTAAFLAQREIRDVPLPSSGSAAPPT